MSNSTLLVSLHQALTHMGLSEHDVHFVMDWIDQDMKDIKVNQRLLLVAGILGGLLVGIVLGNYLCLL